MKQSSVLVPPGTLISGTTIELDDAEQHHLRVRRIADDERITLLDGIGSSADATVAFGGRSAVALVGAVQQHPAAAVTLLAVGAGDRERFLGLAERCTELGVTHLVPLQTERSQAVDNRLRVSALDKARRRAREACKQSGNPWATVVDEPCRLDELATRFPAVRWLVAAIGGVDATGFGPAEPIGWIVGPEGGLAPDESAFALANLGAMAVTLGPHILRFDTAAVAAAVLTTHGRALPTASRRSD